MGMTIATTTNDAIVTIALDGWLDTTGAPQLAEALNNLDESCTELVLDFENLEYISSAGLRQIVSAHKKMKGNVVVRNVKPEVMQVFHMAGFDKRLNIS
ncbi:MAG: STAS domain-containing protein [Atopobiaceae bacterium]|nr:STAS domain-containing protein [Atopobiaceae bacterium]MBR3315462.1 STAS domain-containing protein [Atopobiaceae bacterium]